MFIKTTLQQRITEDRSAKRRAVLFSILFMLGFGVLLVHSASARSGLLSPFQASLVSMTPQQERLMSRLNLPDVDVTNAIEERKALLNAVLTVRAELSDGTVVETITLRVADNPSWIVFEKNVDGSMHAHLSEERMHASLDATAFSTLPEPVSCTVLSTWKDEYDVLRAQTNCIARSGYAFDRQAFVHSAKTALEQGTETLVIPVTSVKPTITDADYAPDSTWTLLATGHSNFKGSGDGRKANVRKALTEKVHNVLIPKGDVFSFADALGGSITIKNGWKNALTIFEGVNLRPAPGGGVCQASTTLYRAVLRAGLPIVEQKNHSLYVSYYEAHGVGQDATVFPGLQDFRFTNDTAGPILLQSYYENDEAFVQLYGLDDRRDVTLAGPYFSSDQPQELLDAGKTIRGNEIVWVRTVTTPDAVMNTEILTARYKAIPKSLQKKYVATTEETRQGLHAAASSKIVADTNEE